MTAPDDYEDTWQRPKGLRAHILSFWVALTTPNPSSLEEARARLAAAKPIVYTDEQIAAFEKVENENFGPMCGCTPRKWWQRWL